MDTIVVMYLIMLNKVLVHLDVLEFTFVLHVTILCVTKLFSYNYMKTIVTFFWNKYCMKMFLPKQPSHVAPTKLLVTPGGGVSMIVDVCFFPGWAGLLGALYIKISCKITVKLQK